MISDATKTDHLVIGVGNRWRRDDGVGPVIVDEIAALELPHVTVSVCERECSGLLDLWEGVDCAYIVDAATGPAPGTIHRFDAVDDELPPSLFGCSSHNFGVVQAIEMARMLNRLPQRLVVFGVAGQDFDMGTGLSAQVADSAPILIADIVRELTTVATGDTAG